MQLVFINQSLKPGSNKNENYDLIEITDFNYFNLLISKYISPFNEI